MALASHHRRLGGGIALVVLWVLAAVFIAKPAALHAPSNLSPMFALLALFATVLIWEALHSETKSLQASARHRDRKIKVWGAISLGMVGFVAARYRPLGADKSIWAVSAFSTSLGSLVGYTIGHAVAQMTRSSGGDGHA